jgi:hypothetical protein
VDAAAPPDATTLLLATFLLDVPAGRAEGGPAEPAARRRGAPTGGAAGRRPIRPVDARLQNDSVDASDAHDTLSEDDGCT